MKIQIIGLGYVGQTLALALADTGFMVYGSDVNDDVLDQLKRGQSNIQEKNLLPLLRKHINKNFFVGKPEEIYQNEIDVHIACISTPIDRETQKINLDALKGSFEEIGNHLKKGQLVILRSTVPVGTARNYVKPILEKSGFVAGEDFYLVVAPERTAEGVALQELRSLPQIIGGINEKSIDEAIKIFRRLTPTITCVSSLEAAELVKLLDNSYRDMRFAYAQEVGYYCKRVGLDAFEVIKASNQGYARNNIPVPSPGVGGICLNKDPYIFLDCASQVGINLKLVKASREINEIIPKQIAEEIKKTVDLTGKKVFIAGFAFKGEPETNDIRDSPTIELLKHIRDSNPIIYGFDPVVESWKIKNLDVNHVEDLKAGLSNADIAIFMTNHALFRDLETHEIFSLMKPGGLVFDGWGLFNKGSVEKLGLTYKGVSSG